MTLENQIYGAGWVKCARCTVHDSLARKVWAEDLKGYVCSDGAQCARWRAELVAKDLIAGVKITGTVEPVVDLDFATGPRPEAAK